LESQIAPQPVFAPIDGVVTAVQHQAGEHVQTGESLLVITAETSRTIVAYVRLPVDELARPGRMLEIRARSGKRESVQARIKEIGPALESIPSGLLTSKSPSAPPEFGLPLIVLVPAELSLRPGELVDLRLIE